MAQYGGEQDVKKEGHQVDEYGNKPVHVTTAGDTGATNGAGVGHGQEQQVKHGDAGTGAGGVLHRSGSGSSSSSEDDGQGGRRKKKGVVEKIKEKLSGDGGDVTGEQKTATVGEGGAAVGGGECGGEEGAEKKGIMDKIKEKLPGGHTQ